MVASSRALLHAGGVGLDDAGASAADLSRDGGLRKRLVRVRTVHSLHVTECQPTLLLLLSLGFRILNLSQIGEHNLELSELAEDILSQA